MEEFLKNLKDLDVDELPDDPKVLKGIIKLLITYIIKLEDRMKELEDKLSKYSGNSSKPPSSDGYAKKQSEAKRTESLREKTERKAGGQKGHKGHTLKKVVNPDYKLKYPANQCKSCGHDLRAVSPKEQWNRQVVDIPVMKMEVTEHITEAKLCPICGEETRTIFPEEVTEEIQYGHRIAAWAIYLQHYHFVPFDRLAELIESTFGHRISAGTLYNFSKKCYQGLANVEEIIKDGLRGAKVLHADESGVSVKGVLNWLHVASNKKLTHYEIHPKRGKAATDAIDILTAFKGTLIHDYWKSYFKYFCKHALCNAHHLRELEFLYTRHNQQWARELIMHLVIYKGVSDFYRMKSEPIPEKMMRDFELTYDTIIGKGWEANPETAKEKIPGKRGRQKKTLEQNMLHRLKEKRNEVLAFMYDLSVPFDNNQAERDIRMIKLKQKISGCFRSSQGGKIFCRIRSYLSTCRKQGTYLLQALQSIFIGKPFLPQIE
jgi:transposase